MDSKEQRIATLAATLKASGIAKSDAQAKMMAEDMVGVEEHVQKSYEEKHAQAQEYIQTAKNLGTPRQKAKVESLAQPNIAQPSTNVKRPDVRPQGTRMVEPIPSTPEKSPSLKKSDLPPAYTDIPFSGKTLNQAFDRDTHDTHNAALEAIKSQIRSKPLVEELAGSDMSGKSDRSPDVPIAKKEIVMQDIDEILEAPEAPKSIPPQKGLIQEIELDTQVPDDESLNVTSADSVTSVDAVAPMDVNPVDTDLDMNAVSDMTPDEGMPTTLSADTDVATIKDADILDEAPAEIPEEHPKLDSQKLVELMEEDGKLEEHTREIKEKPTNVKPKEAYEENNIDLASVFNFNKR